MIIPAILVGTFEEFAAQIEKLEGLFPLIQIDVMDGIFVANKSFDDIEKINELKTNIKFDLHLMVVDPLAELEKWKGIKNISRVIFHVEANGDHRRTIGSIRALCLEAGLALKPTTPLSAVLPYIPLIDVLLFMTVEPGRQGAKFLPAVGEKIKEFKKQEKGPFLAADGGINKNTIALVKSWGIDIFYVGSAITRAKDIQKANKELSEIIHYT